ncbi:hypothetical protein, partial [Bacillus thuringiensis]
GVIQNRLNDNYILQTSLCFFKLCNTTVISNRFHASQKEIKTSVLSFLEHLFQFPEKVLQRLGTEQLLKY